nr:solute carrier family 35 member F1-like isoform X2 [Ciona intestinalis]|eukprot:XP_026696145.1 solute carrier family 35 member F1-like isoform X2 [Ciona intestinalis]
MATTSEFLQQNNVSVPLLQSSMNYFLLGIVYTLYLCFKKDENGKRVIFQVLKKHWWKYALLALIDVEANYMVILAYQYTSLTSVQLLDIFVIPAAMFLSFFFLKVRYLPIHFIGLVIAIIGVVCMVVADVLLGKGGTSSNAALGDFLVLGGATCYAISNVAMEFVSKKHNSGPTEILAMYGLFCPLICGVQMALLERQALTQIVWTSTVILLLLGFGACMFIFYSLMPYVMKISSATAVNISLLTSDLFSLFVGIFVFMYEPSPLYLVSFVTISAALVIYNIKEPIPRQPNNSTSRNNSRSSSLISDAVPPSVEDIPLNNERGTWFTKAKTNPNDPA